MPKGMHKEIATEPPTHSQKEMRPGTSKDTSLTDLPAHVLGQDLPQASEDISLGPAQGGQKDKAKDMPGSLEELPWWAGPQNFLREDPSHDFLRQDFLVDDPSQDFLVEDPSQDFLRKDSSPAFLVLVEGERPSPSPPPLP